VTLPPKKDALTQMLKISSVFIHLNPRGDAVTVPAHIKGKSQVVLQVGRDMPVPIRDLTLSERGWSAGLSFGGQLQYVSVPWDAVFAMVLEDGRGIVWTDSVPSDLRAELLAPEPAPKPHARIEAARMDAKIARAFDGPVKGEPAKVISLVGRKPRAPKA
jgi:stringent starvation protein B